jgi:O-antigen/teichoic acid export membrane protein
MPPANTLTRTRRTTLSLSSNLLFTVATMLVGFVSTPLLLNWLGAGRFGACKVLAEWYTYLPLLELGLGGSLLALLPAAVARDDRREVSDLMSAALRVYAYIVPLAAALLLACAYEVPRLVALPGVGPGELRATILISMIAVLWMPVNVFRNMAEARQYLYVVNLVMVLQSIFTTALQLLAAWEGWGLAGQSLASVVGQMPLMLTLGWIAVRDYPGILRAKPRKETRRKVWALNWPSFLVSVADRNGLLSDSIIVAWLLGPAAVPAFFLTQRLSVVAQAQLQGVAGATWAGLVEIRLQRGAALFEARLLELTALISGLGVAVLGPIFAYNHRFVQRWVGAHSYAGDAVSAFVCVNMWLWSIFSLWRATLTGAGLIRRWLPYTLSAAAVNTVASVAATIRFGLAGPLIGTCTAFLAVHVWALPAILASAFGIARRTLWRTVLAPLAWGLPYTYVLWHVARLEHANSAWPSLLFEMGLAVSGGIALWWIFSLNGASRLQWKLRIQHALAR